MKKQLFLLCSMVSIANVHAMEDQVKGPEPIESVILKTMWEVNGLTGRSQGLASHLSMAKGIHHFPLFEAYFHAAEHTIDEGIATLSIPQEDPTRAPKLLENLTQLRESKANLSPIVKKMETMVRRKIRKQAVSHRTSLEQAAQALIDHVHNAPN